jgi:hypothetical protein
VFGSAAMSALLAISGFADGAPKPIVVSELAGRISCKIVFDDPGLFDAARRCFEQYPFKQLGASAEERQKNLSR